MFYITSTFQDDSVNTFGFMEWGFWSLPPPPPQAKELRKSPGGIGLNYFCKLIPISWLVPTTTVPVLGRRPLNYSGQKTKILTNFEPFELHINFNRPSMKISQIITNLFLSQVCIVWVSSTGQAARAPWPSSHYFSSARLITRAPRPSWA